MPKNILVFSDGTGQAGGIKFDEDRTNVYKLYRATRCGPDSTIDPREQVTFYDPGLGSPADGGFMFGKAGRWLYNLASQATGLGITANIIDCYAAIIRLYRDGDRIFLFGFSRGAYTVRCLGAVIAKCGIPRRLPGNQALPLDVAGSRKLASYAVKSVYQFCSSKPRKEGLAYRYRNFLLDTRDLIALRFRREHGSYDHENEKKANVCPYFIGVFDTVAALGRSGAVIGLVVMFVLIIGLLSAAVSLLTAFSGVAHFSWLKYLTPEHVFIATLTCSALAAAALYALNYIKYDFRVPGYGFWKSLATLHLAPRKQKFTDYSLNPNVEYAKHAISIDEDRADFKRVPWNPDATREGTRDQFGNINFEQVWFAGVHADIGGGYPENESRLSDITMNWMLSAASIIPSGIKADSGVLCLYPDATGPQHDECKAGHWERGIRELPSNKTTGISVATMHKSVYERFAAAKVVQYDAAAEYRPQNLRHHADFENYFTGGKPLPQDQWKALADDVEGKWEIKRRSALNGDGTES
jgi:hypothetical protein